MDFSSSPLGVRGDIAATLAARISQLAQDAPRDKPPKRTFVDYTWPKLEEDYGRMVQLLKAFCEGELHQNKIPAQVEGRVKSRDSIIKSLERRERHRVEHNQGNYQRLDQIIDDLHDLAGIRIVLDYPSDTDALAEFIDRTFIQVKEPNHFTSNRRVGERWKPWFGDYNSCNHRLAIKPGTNNVLLEPYCDVMFEIQVPTLSGSLYNKLAHPLLHKQSSGPISQKDEMVIEMAHGLALCYSICLLSMQDKLEGPSKRLFNEDQLQDMRQARGSDGTVPAWVPDLPVSSDNQSSSENCNSPDELWQWITTKLEYDIQESRKPPIRLPTIEEARFDSEDVQGSPKCHLETRIDVRSRIASWVNDVAAETLFWLHAPAGTGKSTLARTLVDDILHSHNLGAGYFFRRGAVDRNSTSRVFPTIASQLLETIPNFATSLRKSVHDLREDSILKKSLEEQFKILLEKPLSELIPFSQEIPAKVIIIDALDECHYEDKLPRFLTLLSGLRHVNTLRLCVLFTNRSDNAISDAFQELKEHGPPLRTLPLRESYKSETKQELRAFLTSEFDKISNRERMKDLMVDTWPAPEDINFVVERATEPSPLFIYASALIRFIDDPKRKRNPIDRLQTWISQCQRNKSQLDQMYRQILEGLFQEDDDGDDDGRWALRNILGCLVTLAKPLPAGAIAALLDMPKPTVAHWLRNLQADVHFPSDDSLPVELIHTSFSDFL